MTDDAGFESPARTSERDARSYLVDRHETGDLAAAFPTDLAPFFAEVAELKRVGSDLWEGRSLADARFRRAWAALVAGASPQRVAFTELAVAGAHVSFGNVDGTTLTEAGVSAEDRRVIYHRAAERALGPLEPPFDDAIESLADGFTAPVPVPEFVTRLSSQQRVGPPKPVKRPPPPPRAFDPEVDGLFDDHVGEAPAFDAMEDLADPFEAEERQSEHSWTTAVIAGIIQRWRNEPIWPAVLLGLVHHAEHAFLPEEGPENVHEYGEAERNASLERALAECPPELAATCRTLLAERQDTTTTLGSAFNAANVVDRILQQRHYANVAGLSLSDAVDGHDVVRPGPLEAFHLHVLETLRLAF
ncbi:hypothetical protein L1787_24180 [Acuticoccus sp. M5D2P5]|uniref:hypothetical protein n=1 Tax=Acuticoccus kalidii TaxID=2910977 RepID=UPI001F1BD098|nr:hypothetical protein [Acuticoccus kalidii]MCF3936493.1 hypothetical protein [Acuticoccus kalidii]